ncbi:interferon-induced protein 44-like [Arapaima gigas]
MVELEPVTGLMAAAGSRVAFAFVSRWKRLRRPVSSRYLLHVTSLLHFTSSLHFTSLCNVCTRETGEDMEKSLTAKPGFTFATKTLPDPVFTGIGPPQVASSTKKTKVEPEDCKQHKTFTALLDTPWRKVDWSEEHRDALMSSIFAYKPSSNSVSKARVLLLGPVGAGKSSFISSVQSVFSGRVINRAMVGSSSTSFTKKLQSFNIRRYDEKDCDPSALVLCDVMGLEGGVTGLTLHDTLAIIKGHVPEGHKFSPAQPVRTDTAGFVKKPYEVDRVHCVVYVIDASKLDSCSQAMKTTFSHLREHISDLGVHQVAVLTHVDQVCPETDRDVSNVYRSRLVQQAISKAGALLGMSNSYIVPVKNYYSELELDGPTDTLLLCAIHHILQYVQLYFQDNAEPAL